ncbi:TPA: YopX family protein [Enterococcus faecium]|uniref:YopX protein domain-containing protein n=1 Tax=Enterococcus faecium TaxID=1352 RepID=A0A7V7GPV9_ENTFC|nr:YopX family protein [Enterococcus faecium]KAA0691634.1 hypothetical protein DTX73_04790 [Enterococcus faecium]
MIPKFRAWDRYEEAMTNQDGIYFGAMDHDETLESLILCLEERYELMQFTGLRGKNGIEIFEGDIVQWGDTPDWEEEPIRVAVVKINPDIQFDSNVGIFEYGRFIYRDTERFLTVLGNVYENSELLEVE